MFLDMNHLWRKELKDLFNGVLQPRPIPIGAIPKIWQDL
jgi:hypothetical protein